MELDNHELAVEAQAKAAQVKDLEDRLADARWFLGYCRTIYGVGSDESSEAFNDVLHLEKRLKEVLND